MLDFFWILLWFALTALMIAAGVRLHVQRKELSASPTPRVDDDALNAILTRGQLTVEEDEPLDLTEIDEREERFWSESWDEPEEW
jgi:hypothetical protein